MLALPDGSPYFWMYEQGLKHIPYAEIELAFRLAGRTIREKDTSNYWNGWYHSDLYGSDFVLRGERKAPASNSFLEMGLEDYPLHPYLGQPEITKRWVPCNSDSKPMIKWGTGCLELVDAKAYSNQEYVGENLHGCKMIVIDCDGDHSLPLDMDAIGSLWQWSNHTHTISKPKLVSEYEGYEGTYLMMPASFHLTFAVDRLIPTMHFPYASMDIIGNAGNSIRYWKNKTWNGAMPMMMTPEIWESLKSYVRRRKENAHE